MIIQAELRRKQSEYEGEACSVDKVIELPAQRFKQFSRALLADYDFIAENKNAIRHDEDARHCLLILDADGTDGFLVDPQGYNYARYSAFVPNARSLLTLDMGIDRSYLSPVEPWRNENRDEMLRVTLRVEGKPDYTLVLPADEEYLDAVKAYLDIDAFADAMLCDIRFKVPYIGELIRDTDCPAVEDYNDFAEALEDIWQQDGLLLTYPPARRKLAEHGISCEGHAARQLTNRDYDEYDLLIGMDQANLRDMYRICGGDYVGKMSLLMDHTAHPGNVADPWYTEDFEATWQDVLDGCQGLLKEFMTERGDSNGTKR